MFNLKNWQKDLLELVWHAAENNFVNPTFEPENSIRTEFRIDRNYGDKITATILN